ncbi:MAG: (deoxy)nucleoside triphosphate pyrophosphohydrolase [Candidatus Riflebacteria bacterium]|nr:(deoxy)nucleoside triphosphate pyrophosphohydrolase [Candidatus Riflebacteria bacterium]
MRNNSETIQVAAAVIVNDGKVLLGKRQGGLLDGKWEFPGGKIKPFETSHEAAIREIKEELGISICPLKTVYSLEHSYPDKTVNIHFCISVLNDSEKAIGTLKAHSEAAWFSPSSLPETTMCEADRQALSHIDFEKIFELIEKKKIKGYL